MKTITNIKRGVKHSIKHRAQRKHKTHKNKHTKTQLKQYKTHRGGAGFKKPANSCDRINSNKENEVDDAFAKYNFTKLENDDRIVVTYFNVDKFRKYLKFLIKKKQTNTKCIYLNLDCYEGTQYQMPCYGYGMPTDIQNLLKNITVDTFNNLKTLELSHYDISLQTLPDSIGNLTSLTTLSLTDCMNLVNLPETIGELTSLTTLKLFQCHALINLPVSINKLTSLTTLKSNSLKDVTIEAIMALTALTTLDLRECYLLKLPDSIGSLRNLRTLDLTLCRDLKTLPNTIGNLKELTTLNLYDCYRLENLPELGNLSKLTTLDLRRCYGLTQLPESIGKLSALTTLELSYCAALTHLPESIWLLLNLRTITYNSDTIKNPEILYLMPQITLSKDDNTKYLNKIKADSDDNLMYNIKISDLNSFLITQLKAYELNIDKSIVEQIEIFTNLRNSSNA